MGARAHVRVSGAAQAATALAVLATYAGLWGLVDALVRRGALFGSVVGTVFGGGALTAAAGTAASRGALVTTVLAWVAVLACATLALTAVQLYDVSTAHLVLLVAGTLATAAFVTYHLRLAAAREDRLENAARAHIVDAPAARADPFASILGKTRHRK